MALLLLGQFRTELIIPLGLAAGIVGFYWVLRALKDGSLFEDRKNEQRIVGLMVIILVSGWAVFNMFYTAQNLFVYRDPAIYAVTGAWLAEEPSLRIPEENPFGDVEGVEETGAGFFSSRLSDGEISAQGLHLLPAFLGLTGRLAGDSAIFLVNPLFGAAALLSVYGFARLIVRPWWALVATATLSFSLPMIYFSRDTYSEPLAMMFAFGALSILWFAQKTNRSLLWLLAGFMAGAGTLTRADAYLTLIAFFAFLSVYLIVSPKKKRQRRVRQTLLFATGCLITSVLGWVDLTLLSSAYYSSLRNEVLQELMALSAVILLTLVAIPIIWKSNLVARLKGVSSKKLAYLAVAMVASAVVVFATRPYWHAPDSNWTVRSLGGHQATIRLTGANATRTADAVTDWVHWYLGYGAAVLGTIGLLILVNGLVKKHDSSFLPLFFVVFSTVLVYFVMPSITPDHIWASRRLLPIVLPGIVIFAVYGIESLSGAGGEKRIHRLFVVLLAAILLAGPISLTSRFWKVEERNGQLAQIDTVCDSIPPNGAILWTGIMRLVAVQSTKALCDIPSEGIEELSLVNLKEVSINARKNGYVPIIGVVEEELVLMPDNSSLTDLGSLRYTVIEKSLYKPPDGTVNFDRRIFLGKIQQDGSVVPLR